MRRNEVFIQRDEMKHLHLHVGGEPGYLCVANERSDWGKAGSTGLPRYLRPRGADTEAVLGSHGWFERLRCKVVVRSRYVYRIMQTTY